MGTSSNWFCYAELIFLLMLVASRLTVKNARLWLLVHSLIPAALNGAPLA